MSNVSIERILFAILLQLCINWKIVINLNIVQELQQNLFDAYFLDINFFFFCILPVLISMDFIQFLI